MTFSLFRQDDLLSSVCRSRRILSTGQIRKTTFSIETLLPRVLSAGQYERRHSPLRLAAQRFCPLDNAPDDILSCISFAQHFVHWTKPRRPSLFREPLKIFVRWTIAFLPEGGLQ